MPTLRTTSWSAAAWAALITLAGGCAPHSGPVAEARPLPDHVLTAPELVAIPHRAPDFVVPYGEDSSQYGELRIPAAAGPHPVVILIHGGCWRADFATAESIGAMADALTAEGFATWSIEYRRLHQPGGGWPGTYLDVGRAVDHLASIADAHHLDLARVVVVGHSAGGHLAMWAAARSRLPKQATLYQDHPLPLRGVVDLDGTPDLADSRAGLVTACGEPAADAMAGGTPDAVPEHYAEVSAIRLLPLGIPQVLIWGARDDQIPLALAERYVRAATDAGDPVRLVVDSTAGHFESASPRSRLWPEVRSAIRSLLDQ